MKNFDLGFVLGFSLSQFDFSFVYSGNADLWKNLLLLPSLGLMKEASNWLINNVRSKK